MGILIFGGLLALLFVSFVDFIKSEKNVKLWWKEFVNGKYFLFLDDERDPSNMVFGLESGVRNYTEHVLAQHGKMRVIQAKTYDEFLACIEANGLPAVVSFDHDIADFKDGAERSGKTCLNWLCHYCLDNDVKLPECLVHTGNPSGRDNLLSYVNSFNRVYRTRLHSKVRGFLLHSYNSISSLIKR